MKDWAEEAFDELDAGFFSGDSFHDEEAIERIESYMRRWKKEIVSIKEIIREKNKMNTKDILKIMVDPDHTINTYLYVLLTTLWREGEGFNSKRPFGDSCWEFDLYAPLIRAGVIKGELNEEGGVEVVDPVDGYHVIQNCIEYIFNEKE